MFYIIYNYLWREFILFIHNYYSYFIFYNKLFIYF